MQGRLEFGGAPKLVLKGTIPASANAAGAKPAPALAITASACRDLTRRTLVIRRSLGISVEVMALATSIDGPRLGLDPQNFPSSVSTCPKSAPAAEGSSTGRARGAAGGSAFGTLRTRVHAHTPASLQRELNRTAVARRDWSRRLTHAAGIRAACILSARMSGPRPLHQLNPQRVQLTLIRRRVARHLLGYPVDPVLEFRVTQGCDVQILVHHETVAVRAVIRRARDAPIKDRLRDAPGVPLVDRAAERWRCAWPFMEYDRPRDERALET